MMSRYRETLAHSPPLSGLPHTPNSMTRASLLRLQPNRDLVPNKNATFCLRGLAAGNNRRTLQRVQLKNKTRQLGTGLSTAEWAGWQDPAGMARCEVPWAWDSRQLVAAPQGGKAKGSPARAELGRSLLEGDGGCSAANHVAAVFRGHPSGDREKNGSGLGVEEQAETNPPKGTYSLSHVQLSVNKGSRFFKTKERKRR